MFAHFTQLKNVTTEGPNPVSDNMKLTWSPVETMSFQTARVYLLRRPGLTKHLGLFELKLGAQ